MTPARRLQLLFAACSMAAVSLVASEGWVLRAYPDPVVGNKLPTACAGVTGGIEAGKTYSQEDCVQRTAVAMVEHAAPIMKCVPEDVPVGVLSVFAEFSYNAGSSAFCASTMSKRALAGDYRGACDAFLMWYRAGGLDCRTDSRCRGLWLRRQDQRSRCLAAAEAS